MVTRYEAGVSQLLTLLYKVKNGGEEMYQIANTQKLIRYNTLLQSKCQIHH